MLWLTVNFFTSCNIFTFIMDRKMKERHAMTCVLFHAVRSSVCCTFFCRSPKYSMHTVHIQQYILLVCYSHSTMSVCDQSFLFDVHSSQSHHELTADHWIWSSSYEWGHQTEPWMPGARCHVWMCVCVWRLLVHHPLNLWPWTCGCVYSMCVSLCSDFQNPPLAL